MLYVFKKVKQFLPQISVAILVVLLFLPIIDHQFLNWDDDYHLYDNRSIERLDVDHLKMIFLGHVHGAYLPLTFLSFSVENHFFGLNPKVFYLNNLILHTLAVLLVIHLGKLLGLSLWARMGAAIIFGIHPMHVESVAWISERKDVLYTVFYLTSLISYLNYIRFHKIRNLVLCFFVGILSLLAKPMALSLPLILFLMDWFLNRPFDKKLFIEKIPFIVFIPLTWISFSMIGVEMFNPSWKAFLTVCWMIVFYLGKFFLPLNLSPIYTLPEPVTLQNPVYLKAFLLNIFFVICVIKFRQNRWWILAVSYFLCSIFFLLRLSTNSLGTIYVANHYMYLPSLGFCWWLGYGIDQCRKMFNHSRCTHFVIGLLVVLIVITFCFESRRQIGIWKNNLVFWNFVIDHNPTLPTPFLNRGIVLAEMHRYTEALNDFNQALRLKNDYIEAFNNRGNVYAIFNDHSRAVEDYTQAITFHNLACLHRSCDQKGSVSSKLFVEIPPGNVRLARYLTNRSLSYVHLNQMPLAERDCQEATQLNPYSYEAQFNCGFIYKERKRWNMAILHLSKAIRINHQSISAYSLRMSIYEELNDWSKVFRDWQEIRRIDPYHDSINIWQDKLIQKQIMSSGNQKLQ